MKALLVVYGLISLFASQADAAPEVELVSKVYHLEPHHWLWLERIARAEPKFAPESNGEKEHEFEMYTAKSAKAAYENCGMEFGPGESIIYGAPTSQMIARLSEENHQRMILIHRTLASWRNGRFSEWHHSGFKPPTR